MDFRARNTWVGIQALSNIVTYCIVLRNFLTALCLSFFCKMGKILVLISQEVNAC